MKIILVVTLCLIGLTAIQGRPQYSYSAPGDSEETEGSSSELSDSNDGSGDSGSGEDETKGLQDEAEDSSESEGEYSGASEEEDDEEEGEQVPILVDSREYNEDGTYTFRIEQGDGVERSETGTFSDSSEDLQVVGGYSFTHPDGTFHQLTYEAGKQGFQPSSDMLPTPHPLEPWHLEQIAFAEAQKRAEAEASDEGAQSEESASSDEAAYDGASSSSDEVSVAEGDDSSEASSSGTDDDSSSQTPIGYYYGTPVVL